MNKKVFYSMALVSALMLGACSSSDDVSGGSGTGENNTSYIAVNINNVGAAPGTRADYNNDKTDGTYEDGTGIESAINKVRFYFFNADGTPYILNNPGENGHANYVDVSLEKNGADHNNTVETVTKATLILNGETNLAPASMLTVVNPDASGDLLGTGAQRYSLLRRQTVGSVWKNDKGFVMSNSVYKDAGLDICTTQLANKLYNNAEDANSNPTDVYVERVLAKVSASVNENYKREGETDPAWIKITSNDELYHDTWRTKVGTLSIPQADGQSKEVDVYAWIQGWGVADGNGKAEFTKQIRVADWTDATVGITPWNTADYHRCFWSNSVEIGNDNPAVNYSFNEYNQHGGSFYTMPNTPNEIVSNPYESSLTKLLVAAKLGYKDGENWKPAEICEYKGQQFLGIDRLKTIIAGELGSKCKVKTTGTDGTITYTSFSDIKKIEFKTSTSYNNLKDYQVVAELPADLELYMVSNSEQSGWSKVDIATINKELAQNPAEIRTDGDAYYFAPIKHLGKAGSLGEYGIVRNHSYKITINDMQGFGTPVFDPSKTIIPTIPTNDKSYLAAKINVLSWRVVNSTVDLDKTK